MTSRRNGAKLVGLVAGLSMVVSAALMARRVAAFHRDNRREVFAFQAISSPDFSYAGRTVTIASEGEGPRLRVVVRYGDEKLSLTPSLPSDTRLPGLAAHQDWLRVLRFASATGTTLDALRARMDAGEVRDRLVIVTRSPEPGAEPSSWSEVNPRGWKFDFYEFLPSGDWAHERLAFPVKRRANLRTGEVPEAPADELKENTWQFQAALMVMPPARGPSPQFSNDGLHAMGWTLPATSLSMLTLLGAVIVAAAPRKGATAAPGRA